MSAPNPQGPNQGPTAGPPPPPPRHPRPEPDDPLSGVPPVPPGGEWGEQADHQPIPPITHVFTPKEIGFIQHMMVTTPKGFLVGTHPGFDTNIRVLGMGALAFTDLNLTMPVTQYSFQNLPPQLNSLITLGAQYYMMLMMQAGYSLIDINYNDNGFTMSIDRSVKIRDAAVPIKEQWEKMILNYKRALMLSNGGVGLGTPRYQSNMSRFLGMLGGGAFGWNIP